MKKRLAIVALALVVLASAYLIYDQRARFPAEYAPDPLWRVDTYLKELLLGNIAFNAPRSMKVDGQTDIHVLVSASRSMDEIRAELERRIGREVPLEAYPMKLGPLMEAHLTGQNFTIQAVTPEKQAVASSTTTEWQWEVTPRRGGHQVLHLSMNVILYLRNNPEPRTLQTFDRTIEVEVSVVRRVTDWSRDNWFWLLPLIAAVVAIVKWIGKKSKDKKLDKAMKGPVGFASDRRT